MGWLGWGFYAARRLRRVPRRQRFSYTNIITELVAAYLVNREQSRKPNAAASIPERAFVAERAPEEFETQDSWEWSADDLEYYRYATERWRVHVRERWGVLELPAGKSAAYNFFGIIQLHEHDERGAIARGSGPGGEVDDQKPMLVLFRLADGYNEGFAAVQSWSHVKALIEQDRAVEAAGQYPRPSLGA